MIATFSARGRGYDGGLPGATVTVAVAFAATPVIETSTVAVSCRTEVLEIVAFSPGVTGEGEIAVIMGLDGDGGPHGSSAAIPSATSGP